MEICMACTSNFKSSQDLDEECRFWSGRRSPTSNSPGSLHFAPALPFNHGLRTPNKIFFMTSLMLWLILPDWRNKLLGIRDIFLAVTDFLHKFCHSRSIPSSAELGWNCLQKNCLQKAMLFINFEGISIWGAVLGHYDIMRSWFVYAMVSWACTWHILVKVLPLYHDIVIS